MRRAAVAMAKGAGKLWRLISLTDTKKAKTCKASRGARPKTKSQDCHNNNAEKGRRWIKGSSCVITRILFHPHQGLWILPRVVARETQRTGRQIQEKASFCHYANNADHTEALPKDTSQRPPTR
jgi:hypothetical protein